MSLFHVLFIDSYDSFCFNVQRLLEQQLNGTVEVTTIRNDSFQTVGELNQVLPFFDAVVIGPGPGNPKNGAQDVGILNDLFHDKEMITVPILGICLGMQAMCLAQGCDVEQLDTIKHGQVYEMLVTPEGYTSRLFDDCPPTFKSTRYHSLHVVTSNKTTDVIPLVTTKDENGQLLMGVQIKERPWFAVQYHPESCCSIKGDLLIQNFIKLAQHWNQDITGRYSQKIQATLNGIDKLKSLQRAIDRTPLFNKFASPGTSEKMSIFTKKYQIPNIINDAQFTLKLVDQIHQDKFIFASSSLSANRGEWSIIALPDSSSLVYTHFNDLEKTTIHKWQDPNLKYDHIKTALNGDDDLATNENNTSLKIISEDKEGFWKNISNDMKGKLIDEKNEELKNLPFIGGLVGILGYEMGSYISNDKTNTTNLKPDAKLVFINNCILVNHVDGIVYLVSRGECFPEEIINIMENNEAWERESLNWKSTLPSDIKYDIVMSKPEKYSEAFNMCQDYMHKGDSYEICLTTQTTVTPKLPSNGALSTWRIFQTLVQRNPAPFTSYLEFNDLVERYDEELCLISSSPERFLKWDQDICELRPIKGTVKKTDEMNLEKATKILKTPKEFGENLMILDLIRNDLYELLPNVKVEEFMSVEEYKTVYQLVSVVRATGMSQSCYTGMDILKHSLPPGSMTGAPKKITVEMLQHEIEPMVNEMTCGGRRGVYSGVTGYWSLNGRGDWSVNIRCMYSYDSGTNWHLGAGGAITVLSTLEGEREEMFTKLETALQVFQ